MLNMVYTVDIAYMATNVAIVPRPQRRVRGGDPMPTKEFLNVRQAAQELDVHENTVRNLEKRGQLKAIRLPGSGFRRFRKQDIERMRAEMWSQFAPPKPMPDTPRRPSKRAPLTDADYEH